MAVIGLGVSGHVVPATIDEYLQHFMGRYLVTELEKLGHKVVSPDYPGITHYVSLDYDVEEFRKIEETIPPQRRILLVFEPSVVLPSNYSPLRREEFQGGIIAFTPEQYGSFLPLPQLDWKAEKLPLSRENISKSSVCLINANKISLLPGSNYGLRRKVIRAFARSDIEITLAGPGWDRSFRDQVKENLKAIKHCLKNRVFPNVMELSLLPFNLKGVNYVGPIENKYSFANKFDFGLVIENSNHYVSEKIFDAVLSGLVPLYVGPELSNFGIPSNIAAIIKDRPSAFVQKVKSLSSDERNKILEAGRSWIGLQETYETWGAPHSVLRVANKINSLI